MVTFIGTPNMLVVLKPPIGTMKHVRFDTKGEYTTENERVIHRFHHKFDSVPAKGAKPTEELSDDLEFQEHQEDAKSFNCKKCDHVADSKANLMVHYRKEHPKEG